MGDHDYKEYVPEVTTPFTTEQLADVMRRCSIGIDPKALDQWLQEQGIAIERASELTQIDYFGNIRATCRMFEHYGMYKTSVQLPALDVYPLQPKRELCLYPRNGLCVELIDVYSHLTVYYDKQGVELPTALVWMAKCQLAAVGNTYFQLPIYLAWAGTKFEELLAGFAKQFLAEFEDVLLLSQKWENTPMLALALTQTEFEARMQARFPYLGYGCCAFDALVYHWGHSFSFIDHDSAQPVHSIEPPHSTELDKAALLRTVLAYQRRAKLRLLID